MIDELDPHGRQSGEEGVLHPGGGIPGEEESLVGRPLNEGVGGVAVSLDTGETGFAVLGNGLLYSTN